MNYRPHRATLEDSLKEIREFKTSYDLFEYLYNQFPTLKEGIAVAYYGYDSRINKHLYIVSGSLGVLGFVSDINTMTLEQIKELDPDRDWKKGDFALNGNGEEFLITDLK